MIINFDYSIFIKSNESEFVSQERQVWNDWDKKDNETSFTNDSSSIDHAILPKEQIEINNERRARAHEKLLMHAYIALSKPPPEVVVEKGEASQIINGQQVSSNHYRLPPSMQSNNQVQQNIVPDDNFYSDNGNQAPMTVHTNTYAYPDSVASDSMPKDASITTDLTAPGVNAKSVAFQKQVLEKFCLRIQRTPIEVLKLNRDEKWQTRYLTVSKEGSWLKKGAKQEACFCPLGLLWVKKFNKSKEHSVLTIDKQGRGGLLLANLVRVQVTDSQQGTNKLTKVQLQKYNDSCIVTLHGKSTFVTFRAERDDADAIMVGCNAIIDVLRGNNSGNTSRPALSMNGSQSLNSRMVSNRSVISTNASSVNPSIASSKRMISSRSVNNSSLGNGNASVTSNRRMVSNRSVNSSSVGDGNASVTSNRRMVSNRNVVSRNLGNSNSSFVSNNSKKFSNRSVGSEQFIATASSSIASNSHALSKTYVANDLWET